MFTGFASENTPAIQVWDFFQTFASTSASRSVSLADDCAPIQHFKTGGTSTVINLYLPSAPIEGKQIKIINANYSGTNQNINIYSSDPSGSGTTNAFIVIGSGQTLDLCYSKNSINTAAGVGQFLTGWISLNQAHIGSYNFNSVALGGNNNYASNSRSAVLGGSTNSASGQSSAVVSGTSNTASGTESFVGGGYGNSANSSDCAILGGAFNTINNTSSVVVGGNSNTASGGQSAIVAGNSNQTSGLYTAILGGAGNNANSEASSVIGGWYGTTRSIAGNIVTPASIKPIASAAGVSQSALLVLGVQTTDATATVLRSNTSAATTTNQVILPNNSAYYFRGECIAGKTAAGDTKGWYIEGVIKRGAGVATTAIVGTATVTSNYADAGAATWNVTATADIVNGGLAITVTGQAATTIRWVCQIRTTEMAF